MGYFDKTSILLALDIKVLLRKLDVYINVTWLITFYVGGGLQSNRGC